MTINENATFNANITVKDTNNNDVVVMTAYAGLDKANMNVNISVNTLNKDLVNANADSVKQQYDEFIVVLEARAKELGYVIF